MITHYGLFWSDRDVFWGKQRTSGQLLGREKVQLARRGAPTKQERDNATDYREFIGLYCLYDDGGDLIYVGEAGLKGTGKRSLFGRLKEHRKGSLAGRWNRFSWFGREQADGQCDVKMALAQLEAVSVAIINPGFNRQSGTFGNAVQVFQVPHEMAEGDLEVKIERLAAKLEEVLSAKGIQGGTP